MISNLTAARLKLGMAYHQAKILAPSKFDLAVSYPHPEWRGADL